MEPRLTSRKPARCSGGLDVCSVPTEVPAAERARWLAELSEALNAARRLIAEMALAGDRGAEAQELYLRIEAARLEVQSLRLSRSLNPREENEPKRIDFAPWEVGTANDA
jgi:hypothetical protein